MKKIFAPVLTGLGTVLFFLTVCLCSAGFVKRMTVILILMVLSSVFLFYSRMREQVKLPLIALSLMVLMDGLSCAYSVSGKFALYEFLKVLVAFCLALLLPVFTKEGGRQAAAVLSGTSALAGLISIDMLSTRLIATPVVQFLGQFDWSYVELDWIEEGVRMTSLFLNPNVFAGCAGIGVLLSLGLAASAACMRERAAHLVCLFVNSLSFVLVFSLGASAAILAGFLALLLLEQRGRRIRLLMVMAETLAVTLLAAFPISLTAFSAWEGVQPVPILCLLAGAAALCALDLLLGQRIAGWLAGHGKAVLAAAAAAGAALVIFLFAAFRLTGGITLQAGETLRRAAYPAPGIYEISETGEDAEGSLMVTIESQNLEDTMMHTSSVIYSGPLGRAPVGFTVPEDSLVVYFNLFAGQETRLESVQFGNESGSFLLPLRYKLLPGFIANRLQGLRANQNAIQRLVFFKDGIKLFFRSPLIGLGMGAYENGVQNVQTFFYGTKYAHNHYIQALAETGLIGLTLFVGTLAVSAAAVWFARKRDVRLAPALGAALAFMAAHACTEVVFSTCYYLPLAFGVISLINECCSDALPSPALLQRGRVKAGILLGWSGLLIVFVVLLGCNLAAQKISKDQQNLQGFAEAASLDKFEWADHMLSYVLMTIDTEVDAEAREQADRYAERLERLNSNSVPFFLAEYYFETGRQERAFEMLQKYTAYVASEAPSWQEAFVLAERYENSTPEFRAGVLALVQSMEEWNANNLGRVGLTEQNEAFVARVREGAGAS